MLFRVLLGLIVSSFLVLQVWGQNSVQTFGWKFREDFLSTKLPACFDLHLVVFPNIANATAGNFSGVPPYYMMAFPQGGQPITMFVGDTNDTLSWKPTHPVGTKLILQMVDSTGSTGGTSGIVFEVTNNPSTATCTAPDPPTDFKISSNITQDGKATLETCQSWRLDINGGIAPYKVVLDARNSPVITNITVPATDDAVVFVDRADSGTVLFAAVVDSTGRWATGTQFVSTVGSSNITCPGRATITTQQTVLNQQEDERRAAQDKKRRTSIIVGVVVTLVLLLLIVGCIGLWLRLRRKKNLEEAEKGQDLVPRQFTQTGSSGQVLSINQFMASGSTTPSPRKSAFSPGAETDTSFYGQPTMVEGYYTESLSLDPSRFSGSSHAGGANLQSRPSFANFPTSSVRRSAKDAEASMSETDGNGSATRPYSTVPSTSGTPPVWPVRSGSLQAPAGREAEIIYQHQDAGQVVRELPPPYPAPPAQQGSDS